MVSLFNLYSRSKEELAKFRIHFNLVKTNCEQFIGYTLDERTANAYRFDDLYHDISVTIDELEKFIDKHGSFKPYNGIFVAAVSEAFAPKPESEKSLTFDKFDDQDTTT